MHKVVLKISNFQIALCSEAAGLVDNVREMFKNYTVDDEHFDAVLQVDITDMRQYVREEALPFPGFSKDTIHTNYIYAGAYDPTSKKAKLLTNTSNAYPFTEEYLMVLTSYVCLDFGKVLFHCAALCNDQNELFLFYGPSGIGKSTTARNFSKDLHLISDDLVILEPAGDGRLKVYKTPFTRDKSNDKENEQTYILKGLYRIHQGAEVQKEEMGKTEAVLSFLGNIWALHKHPHLLRRYLALGKDIVEGVPTYNLHLKKQTRFEEILK